MDGRWDDPIRSAATNCPITVFTDGYLLTLKNASPDRDMTIRITDMAKGGVVYENDIPEVQSAYITISIANFPAEEYKLEITGTPSGHLTGYFLLDIAPDKSQLLLTIKLAGILREKKQEVYYTYTSNPAFTPVLYDKGISNCVLYPDDFRWLKPDLTLLDCRHAAHASLYRQLAIDYIFIAMQLPDQKNIQDKDISILYLPPTPYLSSGSGPRLETLTKRLQDIKKDKEILLSDY